MMPVREFGRAVGNAILEGVGRAAGRVQESVPLASDLLESDEAYLVIVDAPGATASDVQVRYRNGAVLVRIDRFRSYHEGFEMRFPGRGLSLDGRVRLPRDALVDPERATATLRENGTLQIRVPKRDGAAETARPVEEPSREPNDGASAAEESSEGEPTADGSEPADS